LGLFCYLKPIFLNLPIIESVGIGLVAQFFSTPNSMFSMLNNLVGPTSILEASLRPMLISVTTISSICSVWWCVEWSVSVGPPEANICFLRSSTFNWARAQFSIHSRMACYSIHTPSRFCRVNPTPTSSFLERC